MEENTWSAWVSAAAWWGALVVLALLVLFMAGIGVALARGEQPDCHCFGQLHSSPAGWGTLVRNGVLAAAAAVVVVHGTANTGTSPTHWVTTLSAAELAAIAAGVALAGALVFQGWFSMALLRQNACVCRDQNRGKRE